MRRFIFVIGSLSAICASAQGTFDASNNYILPGGSEKAFLWDIAGMEPKPIPKSVGRVRIRHAVPGEPILTPGGESGVPLALDGLFFIYGIEVPGVPAGGSAVVIFEIWNLEWPWTGARHCGRVVVTVSNLGGGAIPPAKLKDNSNFYGMPANYYGPTPSAITLSAPYQSQLGYWVVDARADGTTPNAKLFSSPDLVNWTFVGSNWVIAPAPQNEFRIPEPLSIPTFFKVEWE